MTRAADDFGATRERLREIRTEEHGDTVCGKCGWRASDPPWRCIGECPMQRATTPLKQLCGAILLAVLLAFPAAAQQLDHVSVTLTVTEVNTVFRALQLAPMPWQETNPVIVKLQAEAKAQADALAAAQKPKAEERAGEAQ